MITLKTLEEATGQEVFNQVADHLLTQNKKSRDYLTHMCKYRGADDCKCAVGCLIADSEYRPELEGKVWSELAADNTVPRAHYTLIGKLQTIHDEYGLEDWLPQLFRLAKSGGLAPTSLMKERKNA